jgi:hypothetical protein
MKTQLVVDKFSLQSRREFAAPPSRIKTNADQFGAARIEVFPCWVVEQSTSLVWLQDRRRVSRTAWPTLPGPVSRCAPPVLRHLRKVGDMDIETLPTPERLKLVKTAIEIAADGPRRTKASQFLTAAEIAWAARDEANTIAQMNAASRTLFQG